ncbi:MAG: hypothetical protein Ta2A_10170 [Treponemataceae bacterium]|nr:MAG: hypothetical protein Ta2A_10170 [Treponemataceae bacterium]
MRQGEIWLINLDPTIGAEMKKTRPALIISDDSFGKLPLKIIIPITDLCRWGAYPAALRRNKGMRT